jgi:hypothetical protein
MIAGFIVGDGAYAAIPFGNATDDNLSGSATSSVQN